MGTGIDTGDPEATEIAFFGPSVPIGIDKGPIHGLGRRTKQTTASAPETFGQL
jgi:hypothetical protein